MKARIAATERAVHSDDIATRMAVLPVVLREY
jgi:hypothetical protein